MQPTRESSASSFSSASSKGQEVPLYDSATFEHQLPLYGGSHSVQFTTYCREPAVPLYPDSMKTVDRRYAQTPRRCRSSFALSDIFEDEVEIEISSILPPSPSRERKSSLDSRMRPPRLAAAITNLLQSLRPKKH